MTGSDLPAASADVGPGTEIPPWTIVVDAQRMKTMAAILRDPYPVHWDPEAVSAAGLGDRPINQGPLNLGYVANMLMAWAGDDAVRRLTVRFLDRVVAGDEVTARGTVTEVVDDGGERRARCAVELVRNGEPVLTGTAEVALPSSR